MNRTVVWTSKFKKDYKLAKKRSKDMSLVHDCIDMLRTRQQLPAKYRDHILTGNYKGYRECHVQPDWLLVYRIEVMI